MTPDAALRAAARRWMAARIACLLPGTITQESYTELANAEAALQQATRGLPQDEDTTDMADQKSMDDVRAGFTDVEARARARAVFIAAETLNDAIRHARHAGVRFDIAVKRRAWPPDWVETTVECLLPKGAA